MVVELSDTLELIELSFDDEHGDELEHAMEDPDAEQGIKDAESTVFGDGTSSNSNSARSQRIILI